MAQPRLSRCLRLASTHSSRSLHSAARKAPHSVADLLGTPPAAPDTVIVNGFVRSIRNQKNRSFASIGDGSSLEPLQALLTPQQAQR
jgi:asparaginyl-tRNA synthetase